MFVRRRSFPFLVLGGVVPLVAGCFGGDRGGGDAGGRTDGTVGGSDSSTSADSGDNDSAEGTNAAAWDGSSTQDASSTTFPTPIYDGEGCLTFASAQEICGTSSDGTACAAIDACDLSSEPQCKIDCEMATTLCINDDLIDACLAAVGGSCDGISACSGWMYFAG